MPTFQIDSGEDAQEEFGWKLVHGDVFRPPRKGMLLSVFLGSGTQILCMVAITLVKKNILKCSVLQIFRITTNKMITFNHKHRWLALFVKHNYHLASYLDVS